ncbi:MAG: pyridoxine 5'-phosphate synthase [Proteobacteria bacterium]|nr:pyridoxine 5'-phosphate synthase [Pseudomonadota bacterium]MDE3208456.1 pyridoxine 5'-phosphate synthase [Pseudomonadota bacterium]
MLKLGVNIDHVATLRETRKTSYPSPLAAALIAEQNGADFITLHLREDRRHIQDRDVALIREALSTHMNLELALTEEMIEHAMGILPQDVCIVPERREERTTEGGLDVVRSFDLIKSTVNRFSNAGVRVSLFVNPDTDQIHASHEAGAQVIEIHTGHYADAVDDIFRQAELRQIHKAALLAKDLGLRVNAGHGLNYHNVTAIASLGLFSELNIGHALISQAIFCGLGQAVRDMKKLITNIQP